MKKILLFFLFIFCRILLSLRYRIKIKGKEKLKNLNKPGGALFLPNHPAFLIDPLAAMLAAFPKFSIRPMVVEYVYFTPILHAIMTFIRALPVPNFESSNNSLKRKRQEMVLNEVIKGLKKGENFLLYPAGRLKHTAIEKIGGASATHRIIQEAPEANVILVRIKGLWGSSFSRALTGSIPPFLPTFKKGLFVLLKNLIFFSPRREVVIELEPAPEDFPYHAGRLELNRWLENWYNQPDGLSEQNGERPGDSLQLVSYSMWSKDIPEPYKIQKSEETPFQAADINQEIYDKVMAKICDLTELDLNAIKPEMSLSNDLGLDSLDISELSVFIQDEFELEPIPFLELTTVGRVLGIADRKIIPEINEEETQYDLSKWVYGGPSLPLKIFEGKTIPEVFLNACEKMGNSPAYADSRSGILSYSKLKLAVILFAEKIRHMPGRYIGILLPATSGAFICALACQLAGKIPMMINWTIGPRHLKAVCSLSNVQVVLSSWAFFERLDKVDLDGLEDKLVMLETVRREITLFEKIRAWIRSKKNKEKLFNIFKIASLSKDDCAVLLFTSGTEGMPKGVPLSHDNILSDQRAALQVVTLYSDDVLLAILPPFHSFGFCLTGLIGLLSGMRTAFFPDPTDGKGIINSFEYWGATITAGAPTFIKSMLKAAKPHQLDRMRLCVTGAEKTTQDLIDLFAALGKSHCLVEGYGITECGPILSANIPGQPLRGVGPPLPGIEIIIVHPDAHERLSQGKEGLILARGDNIFPGYLNPGLTSPFIKIEDRYWYNTGDIGYLDQDNFLYISGRKKRFVKVGGEMVSLPAVEEALLDAFSHVKSIEGEGPLLAVIAQEAPGFKTIFYMISTFDLKVDEVNQKLRDKGFSNLIRISQVFHLDAMPTMGTGKINYRQLEETYFKL